MRARAAPPTADLTDTGIEQAKYLNSILNGGGWFAKMTGRFSSRVIVSPLSRCLNVRRARKGGQGVGRRAAAHLPGHTAAPAPQPCGPITPVAAARASVAAAGPGAPPRPPAHTG